MNNKIFKGFFITGLFVTLFATGLSAQSSKPANAKPATVKVNDKLIIDSLLLAVEMQNIKLDSLDSLLEAEHLVSADLREQVIRLDDYRKKLESNVNSFKGENLKLNQSNRILIVFNSLVAVLLIISLVFFIRKIGRKKITTVTTNNTSAGKPAEQMKFTSFEDKLLQLERLGKLREKELLSEEEFIVEKQKILGKV